MKKSKKKRIANEDGTSWEAFDEDDVEESDDEEEDIETPCDLTVFIT